MSLQANTDLLERARELMEETASHPSGYDKALKQAVEANDLERVQELCNKIDGELAQEYFRNYGVIA